MTVCILVLLGLYGDPSRRIGTGAVERGLMVFLISLKACPTNHTKVCISFHISVVFVTNEELLGYLTPLVVGLRFFLLVGG